MMKNFSFCRFRTIAGRLLPLMGMGFLAVGLWMISGALKNGHYDPRAIGAPSKPRPVPDFEAQSLLTEKQSFDSQALREIKKPVLVVFFASWCIPCVSEMPVLKEIEKAIPLWGIDYDDRPAKGSAFIKKSNVNFERLNKDEDGQIGANWGITGVPESFLVMPGGKIAWHADGPLDIEDLQLHILPMIQHAKTLPSPPVMAAKSLPFPAS